MKTIFIVTFLFVSLLGSVQPARAQFLKELGRRVKEVTEETITQKIENKAAEKTGEVMDSILEIDKKIKRTKKRKKEKKQNKKIQNSYQVIEGDIYENKNNEGKVISKKDFIPGNKVLYRDTFKNDAIGDFPVTWNTDSSAEVVTFEGDDTKWLQLGLGAYTPDGIKDIPENCTFEFDLSVSDNFNYYSEGLTLNIISVKNRNKDFMQWQRFRAGKNGVRIRFKPNNFEYHGETGLQTYLDGDKIIDKKKNNDLFTLNNPTVHVGIWRQKDRLRVYIDGEKIWDIPRAFGNANYNAISFNTSGKEGEHFYITNLRLAIAGKDMRKSLLETGKFVTNDIRFDVNKTSIKSDSYEILNELGKILEENPQLSLEIIGHTDSDGPATSNMELSLKRAEAIKNYLTNNFNIVASRLKTTGKGESEPIATNKTAEGKAKNRRVEFRKIN